jgi:antitoxin component HigA of HigAB toxin-antitoxin module
MADVTNFLDKAYETKDFAELAEAPVDALQGLSKADAEALDKALGIKTIRDLATNRFVLVAQAINVLGHKH